MKIMVVDDCETTRRLLGLYLKSKGFETVFAVNGLDGLEKLAREDIGMIMTDLNMPYMDGMEFVRAVRADPRWAAVPVIMVTTGADAMERERALALGANAYMTKPVTADMVTRSIHDILEAFFGKGGTGDVR